MAESSSDAKKANGDESATGSGEQTTPPETDSPAAPAPKEMKAVVLTGYGGLKSIKVLKKPEPTLGEGEVLIRVKACGLNFPDLMLRQGAIDNQPKTPFVMGFECAGEVEAIGEGVDTLAVGDRVAALTELRAWAELVAVPAKFAYKLPKSLDYKEAVAITMNFVVAQALLFDVGNLRDGQTVLVHSVGGGVGQAVVQLARSVPNVTLIGTASKQKHEAIKDSVDHLFDHAGDYVQDVKQVCPDGVDLVLDCLCGDDANKGYNLLKPMGRYVLYGTAFIVAGETKSFFSFAKSWWQVDKVSPMKLYDENKSISGFNLRRLLFQQDRHEYVRSLVEHVYRLYEKKKITAVIDSTWAFEDIPEAMQKMHDRKNIGKLTIDPAQEAKPRPPEEEVVKGGKRKGSAKEKSVDNGKKEDENGGDKKTEEKADDKATPAAEAK